MAHWSTSPEAGRELEVEYNQLLLQYRELKLTGTREEAYQFKSQVLQPVANDLRASREYWRGIGEAVAAFDGPMAEGARLQVKVEDNRDDRDDIVGLDSTSGKGGTDTVTIVEEDDEEDDK